MILKWECTGFLGKRDFTAFETEFCAYSISKSYMVGGVSAGRWMGHGLVDRVDAHVHGSAQAACASTRKGDYGQGEGIQGRDHKGGGVI